MWSGISGIYCPETGIVDYSEVCRILVSELKNNCDLIYNTEVLDVTNSNKIKNVVTDKRDYQAKISNKLCQACFLIKSLRY